MSQKTIILLKSKEGSDEYEEAILKVGCACLFEPLLDIHYLTPDFSDINDKTPLIFTSVHGVESCARLYDGRANPVYTVGDVTAASARGLGFTNILSANGNAEDLAQLLLQKLDKTSVNPAFYICAQDISLDLADFLSQRGLYIQEIIGYRANTVDKLSIDLLHGLDNRNIKAVMVFSSRGAQTFCDLVEQYGRENKLRGVLALCIASSVIKSVSVLPFEKILIAQTPDRDGMMDILNTISIA